MAEKRIEYIDFIKGFCIFLVVWAHCIQNMGTKDGAFFEDPVHILIVSFHMPIFMMLSGFFFIKSIRHKSFSQQILVRSRQLLLPCFAWALISVILFYPFQSNPTNWIGAIKQVFHNTGSFWFLRSVFVCFMVTLISFRLFRKDYVACIVSIIFILLLPDNFRLALDKFMFPFFWMGYFLNKHINYLTLHRKKVIIGSLLLFVFMLFFWEKKYYIYITGMSFYEVQAGGKLLFFDFLPRLYVILFRYLIGMMGSILMFFLLQSIYRPKIFTQIENAGRKTLGIYVIHLFLMGFLITRFTLNHLGIVYDLIITPVTAMLLIVLCLGIIQIIQRNRFTNTLLLGSPFNKNKK